MRRFQNAIFIGTLLIAVAGVSAPTAVAASTLVVWVSPGGVDTRVTTNQQNPVLTLRRAQEILVARRHVGPVVIRVAAGSYTEWGTRWSYVSGWPITITTYNGTSTFTSQGTRQGYGFRIWPATRHADMRLTVRGLRWTDATNGIQVHQATGVRLDRLVFDRIGNRYGPGNGYAALSINEARGTIVESPSFDHIENAVGPSRIHAVYISDASHDTVLRNGRYRYVSGDPVRLRNGSHRNAVDGGTFFRAGRSATLSEWYDPAQAEFRSKNNRIRGVTPSTDYAGIKRLPLTACFAGAAIPASNCPIATR